MAARIFIPQLVVFLLSVSASQSSANAKLSHPLSTRTAQEQNTEESRDVATLVDRLGLQPHPEGGFFVESWRSDRQVIVADPGLAKIRKLGTNIYYLLRQQDFSAWHRLREAEIFYWHAGGALKVHTIDSSGTLTTTLLCDVLTNTRCQYEVNIPHFTWLALEPTNNSEFVLIGDAAFPGFEFEDWELGKTRDLIRQFPQHKRIIKRLSIE